MSKTSYKQTMNLTRQSGKMSKYYQPNDNVSISRTCTIVYNHEEVTVEKDNKSYKVNVPVGERRVITISENCRLTPQEVASVYGGYILNTTPQLIK